MDSMETDDEGKDKKEIERLVNRINAEESTDIEHDYNDLMYDVYPTIFTIGGKQFLIDSVFGLYEKKRLLPDKTVAFFYDIVWDTQEDKVAKRYVCERLPLLCRDSNMIQKIVLKFAELIISETEESNVAKKALRKIIKEHMADALSCFPNIIKGTPVLSGKMMLISLFDEEVRKYGTVAEKMKKIMQTIFKTMLMEVHVNAMEDIKQILSVAIQTSFFTNKDEKRQLTQFLWGKDENLKIDLQQLYSELAIGCTDAIEEAYTIIEAITKWIEGINDSAWNGFSEFLLFSQDIPFKKYSNVVLRKLSYLCRRTNGTAFFFLSPENYNQISNGLFDEWFTKCVADAIREVNCNHTNDKCMIEMLEQVLLIAYSILPQPEKLNNFKVDRKEWEHVGRQVFRQMRNATELLKDALAEKSCEDKEEKEIELKRRINIGILLMELLEPTPTRSMRVQPSWLSSWKPPTRRVNGAAKKTQNAAPNGSRKRKMTDEHVNPAKTKNAKMKNTQRKRLPTKRF